MSSAKAMYDKLQTVKTSGSKTPISDFKSVDLLADKKYMVDGFRCTSTFGSLSGSAKWQGGVLAPNGKIYGIPFNSTTVLEIDVGSCYDSCDWALSPLVNKF